MSLDRYTNTNLLDSVKPSTMARSVTFLPRDFSSIHGCAQIMQPETLRGFHQSLQAKFGIVHTIRP
jgi:hypothetical protein